MSGLSSEAELNLVHEACAVSPGPTSPPWEIARNNRPSVTPAGAEIAIGRDCGMLFGPEFYHSLGDPGWLNDRNLRNDQNPHGRSQGRDLLLIMCNILKRVLEVVRMLPVVDVNDEGTFDTF